MKRAKTIVTLATGVLIGVSMAGPIASAAGEYLQAAPSAQRFFVDGRSAELEAYAIGANEQTWQNGGPVLRKDGTQLVRMELPIPTGSNPQAFWPWKPERLTELFNSCPPGTYQMEAWDVYKDGVFQKTEYNVKVK